jgi:hypothetical protein
MLFNRDCGRLGHTGHSEAEFDFLGPFAPIFKILLQLLRVLVRDIFVRMTDPELFQVPGHTILSKLRSPAPARALETIDCKIMERISADVALSERQTAVGLK